MSHVCAGLLKDVLDIEQALTRELLDAALSEIAGGRVDRQLSADENKISGADSLTIRTYGSGGFACTDCFNNI